MAELPAFLVPHTVNVDTLLGSGAKGDAYAPTVSVPCRIDDTRRLVRSADGTEVISETTVYVQLDAADTFREGSRVRVSGRVATVITKSTFSDGGIGWEHVAVNLT